MKLSLSWIKDFVNIPEDMDLKQLAYDLTMSTVEVEDVEDLARRFDNMVVGVTDGFKKELEINGVGYKASKEGNKLVMNLGYSHLVTMEEIEGITIDVPAPNKVVINGIDKQKVGQFAANVRGKRPPEPYKGKGIKYATETIRHKEGKAGGKK